MVHAHEWRTQRSSRISSPYVESAPAKIGFAVLAFTAVWAAAYRLWSNERQRATKLEKLLKPKLDVSYEEANANCMPILEYQDGHKGRGFRLRVTNISELRINNCIGSVNIENVATGLKFESGKLAWAVRNAPTKIDLSPNVPVYLEMAVAHDANKLIVSVEKYEWPFGEYANWFSSPGEFIFNISIDGEKAVAVPKKVKLLWTGDWETTRVTPC